MRTSDAIVHLVCRHIEGPMTTVQRPVNLTVSTTPQPVIPAEPPLTNAQIKLQGWTAAGSVALPALGSGLAATAAVIVSGPAVPVLEKILEGAPVDRAEAVLAGAAAACSAFF